MFSRNFRNFRDDSGMSLVELLVASTVGLIVLGLLSSIFVTNLITTREAQETNTRADRLNVILATMQESAKNAVEIRQIAGDTSAGGDPNTVITMKVHRPEDPDGVYICRRWTAEQASGNYVPHSKLYFTEWEPGAEFGIPDPKVLLDAVSMNGYAIQGAVIW